MTADLSTLNIPQIINAVILLVGLFGGIFGAHGLAVKNKGKTVITALSDAISKVATAATNENVTEDQFQAIVADARTIHNALVPDKTIPAPPTPAVTNSTASAPPSPQKTS
ncbi:MAG: hypothetical protein KGH87_08185 [Thaumarchaeota archaeon]|nr:hypothetical protein [Nitrososphaerota archaeon]